MNAQETVEPSFHSHLLSPAELTATRSRLSTFLVPRLAGSLQIDPKQVFALERGGKTIFYIEPVRYDSHDTEVPAHTTFRCGMFVLPVDGAATFVPTIGYGDSEPVQCIALKSVRFKPIRGRDTPPRIELYYKGSTPNAVSDQYIAFNWNIAKRSYIEDKE